MRAPTFGSIFMDCGNVKNLWQGGVGADCRRLDDSKQKMHRSPAVLVLLCLNSGESTLLGQQLVGGVDIFLMYKGTIRTG